MLHQAGGVAVLAHPGMIDKNMNVQPQLIRELVERGLDGLEVFYPTHNSRIKKRLQTLARKYNLLCTGGVTTTGINTAGFLREKQAVSVHRIQ